MLRLSAAGLAAILLSTFPAQTRDQTVILAVENMTCVTCPYIVKQTLVAIPGVTQVEVSFEDKTAAVTFEDTEVDLAAIIAATMAVGYPSHPVSGATDE